MEPPVLFWLVLGIFLMLSEIIVPGLVVVFLGIASLFVAFGIWMGWLQGWVEVMTAWFISSLALIFSLRQVFARLAPGNTQISNMDEDVDAIGQVVEVVKTINPSSEDGRIHFRGTTWAAKSNQIIKQGEKAILDSRELNLWVVSPLDKE